MGLTSSEVWGQDGNISTILKRGKRPLFENAQLVDKGFKTPFNDEYTTGVGASSNPTEMQLIMQVTLIVQFVPHYGIIFCYRPCGR